VAAGPTGRAGSGAARGGGAAGGRDAQCLKSRLNFGIGCGLSR
jgi:hypothetical protein